MGAQPFIGEIRMFGGNFAPVGWSLCDGTVMQISGNEALYQLIGTTYGGNGQTTFALPNLQSRVPVHQGTLQGTTYSLGQMAGTETVTLTTQQIPAHPHALQATSSGQGTAPTGSTIPASATSTQAGASNVYGTAPGANTLNPSTLQPNPGNLPHDNLQPYAVLNFIIALTGIYPSQS
jgi:microcystin-dependent protein